MLSLTCRTDNRDQLKLSLTVLTLASPHFSGGTLTTEKDGSATGSKQSAFKERFSLSPPKGTYDLLPGETELWQELELCARKVFSSGGYREIRLPIFEYTELFKRGVGETTDIVNKEMYTFGDKSERQLTLRPEGTAGVVRAFLNGGLHRWSPPVKLWYCGPMFRYESIKTGRQRQFHQVGLEAFGSAGPLIDAEVILTAVQYLESVGVGNLELQINSIGCGDCRPAYREKLKTHLEPHLPNLCEDCRNRFDRNPLRMLDCKIAADQACYKDVPVSIDSLCAACSDHWAGLQDLLSAQDTKYKVNTRLVRGLDYYSRTVFEIVTSDPKLGVESTICAGGRYDNLVELLGGKPTPAVGWALGLERLILLLDRRLKLKPQVFVVSSNQIEALKLASALRKSGVSCDLDYPASGSEPRKMSKQLEQANKSGAVWAVIAGDDELAAGEITLKNMRSREQRRISRSEALHFLTSQTAQYDCHQLEEKPVE